MILYISEDLVKRHTNEDTYKRGVFFFENNCITDYEIDHVKSVIHAQIKHKDVDQVKISYSIEHKQIKCACSCIISGKQSSLCEHSVAALFETARRDLNGEFEKTPFAKAGRSIIELFDKPYVDQNETFINKSLVQLSQTIEFYLKPNIFNPQHNLSMEAEISFKTGISRLYIVRNIQAFLNNIFDQTEFEMGKQFRYIPGVHQYSKRDTELLSFLYYSAGHYEKPVREDCSLLGKRLILNGVMLEKYLDICYTDLVDIKLIKRPKQVLTLESSSKPELKFHLEEINRSIMLDIYLEKDILISKNAKYVVANGKLYRIDPQSRQEFKNVVEMVSANQNKQFLFSAPHVNNFFMIVLPKLNTLGHVEIPDYLKQKIISDKLNIVSKFDKNKNNIILDLQLQYGTITINQATNQIIEGNKDTYLMRDHKQEMNLQSLVLLSGFKLESDHYILSTNDHIYEFLKKHMARFLEIGQVYYSEEFKNLPLVKRPSMSIRMNVENNWLDMDFDAENISDDELYKLLSSIRQKKKYFRLKNGEFLDLEFDQVNKWAQMLDQLEIDRNDIENHSAHVPVYRALYMDELSKDEDIGKYITGTKSFKQLIDDIKNYDQGNLTVPKSLLKILRQYQITGYKRMKQMTDCGLGVILADDMGLGKTLQILTLLLSYKNNSKKEGISGKPSLIVVPTSLVYNWVAEIEKFTPELTVQPLIGTPAQRQAILNDINNIDILLTTYSMIRRDVDLYNDVEFEYCILDESQHVKNPMSIGAKGVKCIRAKKRIAMTGTPIENNIVELWSVFDFIMPGFFGSLNKFNKRFNHNEFDDPEVTRALRTMTTPFIIRRVKSEVLEELPDKIITKMDCDLTKEQKELYMAYLTDARKQIENDKDTNKQRFSILSSLLRLRQICCHPGMFVEGYKGGSGKTELFNEIVEQAVSSGHRILVFSQFTSMLEILKKELDQQHLNYFYLDGSVPTAERIDSVYRFNGGERQLFLISLKAGGFGLNLTGADVVIHYDPWWNPAVENQATDRAHRIGQKKIVQVIRLVAKGTIEDKILSLQEKKKSLTDSILQANDSIPDHLDMEEILELLQS
ncbi:MAG TPA: hypothetical protein DDZ89_02165 [Clostridiales bacterium]|nr:hypothetical protein [Clostridiales bacterium]